MVAIRNSYSKRIARSLAQNRTLGQMILGVTAATLLSGCGQSRKIKLTATVEAHGVEYKGTVVDAYSCRRGGFIFGDVGGCNVRGEAAVIPLGPNECAFLTLSYPRNPVDSMPDSVAYDDLEKDMPSAWDVDLDHAPRLVRFSNINDSKSVIQIDPNDPGGSPGYTFKNLHAEISKDPITIGIVDKYIPWLDQAFDDKWGDLNQDIDVVYPPFTISKKLSQSDFRNVR